MPMSRRQREKVVKIFAVLAIGAMLFASAASLLLLLFA